jgi:putative tryptophan/tyrosine transport system substrate-binding protein
MPRRWSRRQIVQGAGAMGLALLAGCGRWPGQGQMPARVPRVGVLFAFSAPPVFEAFRQGLGELGYVEGQNVALEYRSAEGATERLPELAAELVGLPVDVLVAHNTPATVAAKNATSTIPIVMGTVPDPVGQALVASLARPGGNITGSSSLNAQLTGKRLELLKDALPGATRIAVLWNGDNPSNANQWREAQAVARVLAVQIQSLDVRSRGDVEAAFEAASSGRAEALVVFQDAITVSPGLPGLALDYRLPSIGSLRTWTERGGLLAYGVDNTSQVRRAAFYVDKILKGAKPADLPVEQAREFDFVINLRTAQALGLTLPPHVLLQATEVIQ